MYTTEMKLCTRVNDGNTTLGKIFKTHTILIQFYTIRNLC